MFKVLLFRNMQIKVLFLAINIGVQDVRIALILVTEMNIVVGMIPNKQNEKWVYFSPLQTTTADQLLEFFKQVGEVKFVRMAGDETQPTRFAFVEFADQNSVPRALAFNGVVFGDRPLK